MYTERFSAKNISIIPSTKGLSHYVRANLGFWKLSRYLDTTTIVRH